MATEELAGASVDPTYDRNVLLAQIGELTVRNGLLAQVVHQQREELAALRNENVQLRAPAGGAGGESREVQEL